MTRPQFQPAKRKMAGPPVPAREPILIGEARLNGGMNTRLDPADLPPSVARLVLNGRIEADRTRPRPGLATTGPTKPNSNKVLYYVLCKRFDGTGVYVRFDTSKVHRQGVGSWTEITGSTATFGSSSRPRLITVNDRFFFVTGVDEIQEINFTANTYADLGNAPKYKYICGFFNRIVGANLYHATTPNPTLVGWSGDLNFGEWDPSTDISAGSTPLIEAQADFADPITGLFGFAQVMLILRERSLWTASKRPVASNPFLFQASFPSVGCDTPASATQKPNGILWYDRRTNQVYEYTVGQAPREIGDPVKELLDSRVTDSNLVEGTYDTENRRYHLLVASATSTTTTVFVYHESQDAWTVDEFTNIYTIHALDAAAAPLMIDDLSGTIDSLSGNIDDLVNSTINVGGLYYGNTTGDLYVEDMATASSFAIESKVFALPSSDISVTRPLFKLDVYRSGSLLIQYRRKSGAAWSTYKTVTLSTFGRVILAAPKHITTSEYEWRLSTTDAGFDILEYRVEGQATAETRR